MTQKRNDNIATPKDEWATPDALFKQLDGRYHFGLDAAANEKNRKVDNFISKEEDALTVSWAERSEGAPVFLNPPHSRGVIDKFMMKASGEGTQVTVVCLIPVAMGTNWWDKYVAHNAALIRRIQGRVRYVGYDKEGNLINNTPSFDSCVIVYRPDERGPPAWGITIRGANG